MSVVIQMNDAFLLMQVAQFVCESHSVNFSKQWGVLFKKCLKDITDHVSTSFCFGRIHSTI